MREWTAKLQRELIPAGKEPRWEDFPLAGRMQYTTCGFVQMIWVDNGPDDEHDPSWYLIPKNWEVEYNETF